MSNDHAPRRRLILHELRDLADQIDRWKPQLDALNELVVEHWRRHQRHRSMHDLAR